MDENIQNTIIKEVGLSTERWGFSSAIGSIWSLLYFYGPLTQKQIQAKLSLSIGSVSQSLKILVNLGLIKLGDKKDRKNTYVAQMSMSEMQKVMFTNKLVFEVEPMIASLELKLHETKDVDTKKKIKLMLLHYKKIKKMIKLLMRLSI